MNSTRSPTSPAPVIAPVQKVGAGSRIVFVGASTGGTEALKVFLMGIPDGFPPIMVVQHMPETFTGSFARRLDGQSAPSVVEATDGMTLCAGTVYIAPGHSHMKIRLAGGSYLTELLKTPPVNRHRPAVDLLFHSAAETVGNKAVGVLLTGMGKDGALGLKAMHDQGAFTIAQDEASCVVFGMPREAIALGAVDEILPLDRIAPRLIERLRPIGVEKG